ncbi:MAG: hypothetical protein ACQESR_09590 [Planctomycetota bacterium]
MERCPAQTVLPLVGLTAEKVSRDRSNRRSDLSGWNAARRRPSSRWSDSRRRKSAATGLTGGWHDKHSVVHIGLFSSVLVPRPGVGTGIAILGAGTAPPFRALSAAR